MSDRYSQFFSMSLDMLCIAGTDGYFKELNPTWEQVLGYSQQELLAHPYIERVHPEDHEATIAEAQKLAAGGHETISFVNRYRTKDGNYVWLSWAARVSPSGDTLLAVARDITELKTVAERSREATMAAQMANRAKSEFLANMSHELRTPLNSIIGFSRILGRNRAKTLDDSQLDYIGRINKSGIHLLNLINDVLDISKVEAGRLEVVDEEVNLGQIVEEVTQEMMPQVTHKGISLLVEIPGDLVRLRGDAKRLQQIVTNLVGNAIKFTDQGAVWVRVIAREGRATRVDVIDSGIGISPDHQKRIFEPFAQADGTTARRYGGTGLGLSISHALAQMMGFSLVVDSEPGQGSTFSLLLDPQTETAPTHVRPEGLDNLRPPPPPREDEPAPAPARPSRPFPGDRSKRLLLIVDDDADARAVLEKTFAEDGYSVVAADSAATGIDIAAALRPDLITLDLMMPGLDGCSALQLLKDNPATADIPVLVVSIVAEERRAQIKQAVGALQKPIDTEHLLQTVRETIASQSATALVVDDSADSRMLVREALEEVGLSVLEAPSGGHAFAHLNTHDVHLLVLDLMMPRMDGFTFLAALRADPRYRDIKVVVLTAQNLTDAERERLLGGAQLILTKGDDITQQLRKVARNELGHGNQSI